MNIMNVSAELFERFAASA